jgi:hypothetical protein
MNRTIVAGIAACVAAGFLGSAHADVFPVQGADASGRPGDRVFVDLTYNYGAGFNATVEDFALEYANAGLTFVPQATTIGPSGAPQSLSDYIDSLRTFAQAHQGSVLENTDPILPQPDRKGYALSFFTADGVGQPRSGEVRLRAAFDILATATPGSSYQVSFPDRNVLVNEAGTEFFYPAALQDLRVTVTAVPEPATAVMLLSGLAVIGLAGRRRRVTRR